MADVPQYVLASQLELAQTLGARSSRPWSPDQVNAVIARLRAIVVGKPM